MAGKKLGTVFVELGLDSTEFTKGEAKILQSAQSTSLQMEKNWRELGGHSDRIWDAMRTNAQGAMNAIVHSAKSSEDEIRRAKEIGAAKIQSINEQQFGKQTSLLDNLKSHWLAVTAAVAVAYKAVGAVSDIVMASARYETLGVVMRVVGNNAGYTNDQMEAFSLGLQKTGISMAGSRETLTRMAQAHLDLSKATMLGRVAQDAAVIGNVNSSEAFQRLVYGIQSAQVEMLRTIGINVNFENAYQKVALATGRAATSFSESEKSAIRMNVVLEAGAGIAGTYESAMGTAGKQLLSLDRHFENLKVMAGSAFTPALAEIVEVITGAVVGLNDELGGKSKEAIAAWGTNLRIGIISVEAEFMRVAMLLDKIGGSMTSAQMLLYGPGAALGIESSTRRFEAAAQANIKLENRYKATDAALEALALKQIALENSLTESGKAAAKAAEESLEKKRMAAAEANKEKGKTVEVDKKAAAEAAKIQTLKVDLYIKDEARKWAELDKYEKEYAKENEKRDADLYKSDMERFAKLEDENAKYFVDLKKEEEKAAKEEIDRGEKRLTAERDIYKDLRGYEVLAYDGSKALIDSQAENYRKLFDAKIVGADKAAKMEVAVAAWVAEETRKAEIKKLEASDFFMDGVSAGLKKLKAEQETWGKAGAAVMKTMSTSMASTFSNVFEDAYKGDLKSIKDYSTAVFDSIRKTFFDKIANMAANKAIELFFETKWTSTGADVLGIVNKVLGIAGNIFGSSGSGYSTGMGEGAGGASGYSGGGPVSGSARYPGDHPGNDTVSAWLSPGEVVIRRTAVNSETEAILNYINRFGQPPQYAFGGRVMNQVTDTPGRGYWGFSDFVNIITGGAYGAITGDYGDSLGSIGHIISDVWGSTHTAAIYDLYDAWKTAGNKGDIYGFIDRAMDPGGTVDPSLRAAGELMPRWMRDVAPMVGEIIGQLWGPWMAAAGAGAGAKIAGYNTKEAMRTASMAALMTWISGGGGGGWDAAPETLKGAALSYAKKWAINEALGKVLDNPENGQMNVSYMGADDNGLLAKLAAGMRELAPRSYSAFNGIDRVPYDNFGPVYMHKDERVQTKTEADADRGGSSPIHIHLEMDGREIGYAIADQSKTNPRLIKAIRSLSVN